MLCEQAPRRGGQSAQSRDERRGANSRRLGQVESCAVGEDRSWGELSSDGHVGGAAQLY